MSEKRLDEIESAIRRLDKIDSDLDTLNRKGASRIPARFLERPARSLGFDRVKKRRGDPIWKDGKGNSVTIPSHPAGVSVALREKAILVLEGITFKQREILQDEKNRLLKQKTEFNIRK
ncbi:MAG: hypothetical protein IPI64_11040 [Chloracidobacterium sp.]|nr:hypothetical protein [Chloracidobacterium sp.]